MTALAALKCVTLDGEQIGSRAGCAMSVPLEAVASAERADDWLATGLKLTRTERLFDCGFNPAPDCRDGLFHDDFEVAE